jgi:predicted nucleotidyltransferase
MSTQTIESILKKHSSVLKNEYHVKALYLFGSYARKEETKKSDIDILVEFHQDVGLFHFVALKEYLQGALKKKVDLVTRDAIRPSMITQIERDLIRVA